MRFINAVFITVLLGLVAWSILDIFSITDIHEKLTKQGNFVEYLGESKKKSCYVLADAVNNKILLLTPDERAVYHDVIIPSCLDWNHGLLRMRDTLHQKHDFNPFLKFDTVKIKLDSDLLKLRHYDIMHEVIYYVARRITPSICYLDEFVLIKDEMTNELHFGSSMRFYDSNWRLIVHIGDYTLQPSSSDISLILPCDDSIHIAYELLTPGDRWAVLDTAFSHKTIYIGSP